MTHRHWGIGSGQSSGQKKDFLAQLKKLEQALEKSGGPFLGGQSISLVGIPPAEIQESNSPVLVTCLL